MLIENNEFSPKNTSPRYVADAEEIARQQRRAREDAERHERTLLRDLKLAKEEIAKKDACIAERDACIAERDAYIAERDAYIAEKDACITQQESYISEMEKRLSELEFLLQQKC